MPIETDCQGCGKRLRVADEFAGRRARCPHCKTEYTVTGAGHAAPASAAANSAERWRMKTADGQVFGPVEKPVLDGWLREGRIAGDAQLQRDGQLSWQAAAAVYPSLARPAFAGGVNPFGERAESAAANPYASPMNYAGPFHAGGPTLTAHHGALLLTLSLVGWFCFLVCGVLAIGFFVPTLVIGFSDLRAMREGRMDEGGRGLTLASLIISGIGVGLGVLGVLAMIIFFAAAAAGG